MYRIYILFVFLFFIFAACNKQQKNTEPKNEISFSSPVKVNCADPIITLLDTCAKPLVMNIPLKGSVNYTIPTNNGPKIITLSAPVIHPLYGAEAEGYNFMQNFSTEQKLALGSVMCSYKDKTGNLWFGTSGGGLSKYDGKSFTNFTTSQGLANNLVHCILEDKMGDIWIGTNAGLSKYDGKYFTNYTTDQGLANNIILTIIEDKMGNLWFGSNGGVSKYGPDIKKEIGKSFTNYTTEQGLLSNIVLSSIEDNNGNLWFGTNKGISKYNPSISEETVDKSFTNYTIAQGLSNNYVKSICKDKTGNLWFGTIGGGVSTCNPNKKEEPGEKFFTNYTTTEGLLNNNVLSIIKDRSGDLWIGTREGLSKYDPILNNGEKGNQFVNYTTAHGLPNRLVSSITEDKSGSLWIANSEGGGLSKYDGKSFTSFTSDQGLVHKKVWNIMEDKSENLWFATGGGISKYETQKSSNTGFIGSTGKFTNFRLDHIMNNVRCVTEDKAGNIWFGSEGYGVTRYDGKSYTNYSMAQGLLNNTVLCITEDKTGNLWFGTYGGGVSKFDGNLVDALERGESIPLKDQQGLKKINGKFVKSFTSYTTAQGLADNTVKCILEDKVGNLWFGTNSGGISKFDGNRVDEIERNEKKSQGANQDIKKLDGKLIGSFTNFSRKQGLSNNTIYSILEDKKGILWFGTAGGGVCRLNSEHSIAEGGALFTNYTSAQGLANDVVYAIVEDTVNNVIWFGTNLGLSALQLNTSSSEPDSAKFENFNNNTGYLIKDVNTGALFLDKKGILWAGTSDKLVRFDYSCIHKNTEPPAVFIQAVKIQGGDIVWNNLQVQKLNKREMNRTDSLSILNEEIITYGHHFIEIQHTEMRRKFSEIQFDSITRFYPLPENLVLPYEHNNITFDFVAIETARPFMVTYQHMLEGYDKEWSLLSDKTTATFGNIHEGSYSFMLKAKSPDGVWSDPVSYKFEVLPPWYRTWWMYVSYAFIGLSMIGLFFRWRTASLRKEKEILEHTVIERTAEVVEQKELIEEKQKEIVDSINYAKRIQYTLLANTEMLKQNLKEYFVLFQPKDIVSGDFYWATKSSPPQPSQREGDSARMAMDGVDGNPPPSGELEGAFYLAICDSTGHGVPGAFMSLLNISFLNEAITEKNIKQPHEILNHVRQRLIESVSQDGAQDGMDGILLCFEGDKITYAAANNAPVIVRNNAIINLSADKMPIGKGEKSTSFTLHTIDTQKDDMLYFYTDGYADQFGGPKGKKFKYKQLDELLISINQKTMEEQNQILATTINSWKGNLEQVDDILIIGMRI